MRFFEVALKSAEFLSNGDKLAIFFSKLQKSSWMLSMMYFKRAVVCLTHRLLDAVQTSAWKNVSFWLKPLLQQNPGCNAI